MRRNIAPWILALLLIAFFSWPSDIRAHGDEDHDDKPAGACATDR
jgi:hypothetical protein